MAYGPVAQLGWHAVTTQINVEGQVDGTCVGTGMAFDPAFIIIVRSMCMLPTAMDRYFGRVLR